MERLSVLTGGLRGSSRRRDALALLVLLAVIGAWVWLAWAKVPRVFSDQGWGMQVAARVAAGEVLYRDVTWNYGPLPIYAFVALFRLLGPNPLAFSIVGLALAAAACLLTYRLGRFLLPPGWALLVTLAVMCTVDGGFLSYTLPYSTAVTWGALGGLVTVWGLLAFVQDGTKGWGLVVAGLGTAAACLTKPEFALACLGTVACCLSLSLLWPAGEGGGAGPRWRPLLLYGLPLLLVAGGGYGLLARQAGWPNIWSGLSGYRAAASELGRIAWLGSAWSWLHIAAGSGAGLFLLVLFVGLVSPALWTGRRRLLVGAALGCGGLAVLAFLPIMLDLTSQDIVRLVDSLRTGAQLSWLGEALLPLEVKSLFMKGWTVVVAGGSLFLAGMILFLAARLVRAWSQGCPGVAVVDQKLLVLVVYSCLAESRFFFNIPGAFYRHHLHTLALLAVYMLVRWLPQQLEARDYAVSRRQWGHLLLAGTLLLWMGGNLFWSVDYLSPQHYMRLVSPRGTVLVGRYTYTDYFQVPYQAILARESDGQPIFVVGSYPGFYFLGDRSNPTRWDYLGFKMDVSTARVAEVLGQLEESRPSPILFAETYREWFEQGDAGGRFADWLAENYEARDGGSPYFTIYELKED